MGTQYLRIHGQPRDGVGRPRSYTRRLAQPLSTSLYLTPSATVGQGTNTLRVIFNEAFFGPSVTIIPLSISLGSANRAVTMSSLVGLNPSISLGSANRTVTMSSLIDVNLSVSLGSANRAVTMGVESGFSVPLSISLGSANRAVTMGSLVKPSPAISLGSANRTITIGALITLTQSITYPRNSFISMAVNPGVSLPLLVPWTGAITMGVFVDNGGGSNPQVDGSVAKVTGCGLTLTVTTNSAMLLERPISLGMVVAITVPAFLNLTKALFLAEVEAPRVPVNVPRYRKEDQSYLDLLSPGELAAIRGIPPIRGA